MTSTIPADRKRAFRLAGALIGVAVALGACQHTDDDDVDASAPDDYRQRHPIAIQEADRSIVVFVGRGRGGLSAAQRADVMGMAQTWLREGTGADQHRRAGRYAERARGRGFVAGNPGDLRRRRRAAARRRRPQVPSRRSAPDGGDPAELSEDLGGRRALRPVARGPRPVDPQQELFRKQVRITISAAPTSATSRRWSTIRPTSCSRARRRPPIRPRRDVAFEKYRKGTSTATIYPEAEKAKLSDTGK